MVSCGYDYTFVDWRNCIYCEKQRCPTSSVSVFRLYAFRPVVALLAVYFVLFDGINRIVRIFLGDKNVSFHIPWFLPSRPTALLMKITAFTVIQMDE